MYLFVFKAMKYFGFTTGAFRFARLIDDYGYRHLCLPLCRDAERYLCIEEGLRIATEVDFAWSEYRQEQLDMQQTLDSFCGRKDCWELHQNEGMCIQHQGCDEEDWQDESDFDYYDYLREQGDPYEDCKPEAPSYSSYDYDDDMEHFESATLSPQDAHRRSYDRHYYSGHAQEEEDYDEYDDTGCGHGKGCECYDTEDPLAGDVEPTGGYYEAPVSVFEAQRLSVMRQHGDWTES